MILAFVHAIECKISSGKQRISRYNHCNLQRVVGNGHTLNEQSTGMEDAKADPLHAFAVKRPALR